MASSIIKKIGWIHLITCFASSWLLVGCNHLFYHPHPKIYITPEKVNLSFTEIRIPVDEDVTLHAWKINPARKINDRVAVIQFHGNAENRSTHFLSVAWLADYGADVIAFDYRGYNGSTGSPSRSGLVDDGVAMLKWFEKNYPNSRRFVVGQSLGGAVAVTALAKSKTKIDGLILESTFHSYRGIARMKLTSAWLFWPFQWIPWLLLSGDEDPVDYATEISSPVLAFHDRNDPVVPYASGLKLYSAFPRTLMTLHTNEGERHTGAFLEERKDSRKSALKFMGL